MIVTREYLWCECFKLSLQVRNDYDEKVPLVYQEPGYECRSWTSLETRATKEFIHSRLDPDNINWESGFKERGCQQSKSMHLGQSVTNLTYQHHVPFEKILRIETHQWLWAKIHMYSCCSPTCWTDTTRIHSKSSPDKELPRRMQIISLKW